MPNKMVVKMVSGAEITATGDVVSSVHAYFNGNSGTHANLPIGWVSIGNSAINLQHAISIQFSEE